MQLFLQPITEQYCECPTLNSRRAGILLPRWVSLEWGEAASYAAF